LIETKLEKRVAKYYGSNLEDRDYLIRDFQMLSSLYPDSRPKIVELDNKRFSYLQVDFLYSRELSPLEAFDEQRNISSQSWKLRNLINPNNCICRFFEYKDNEIGNLLIDKMSSDESKSINEYINIAKDHVSNVEKVIVHGDYSPSNILQSRLGFVTIDWEDSFWSIPDYDYLYWLTFMKNQDFLNKDCLSIAPVPFEVSIGILLLITSIKEILANKSPSINSPRQSPHDRLRKVLDISKKSF
jgi:hypothetical protein